MAASTVRCLREIVSKARTAGPVGALIRALETLDQDEVNEVRAAMRAELARRFPISTKLAIRSGILVDALEDCATWIADYDKQKKARANKVQWIAAGPALHVALVGRDVFHLIGRGSDLSLRRVIGVKHVDLGSVSSLEAASRLVRRLRAKAGRG